MLATQRPNAVPPATKPKKEDTVPPIIEEVVKRSDGNRSHKYSKIRLLGKGGFATCYEYHSLETGEAFAAKVIDKATLIKDKTKAKLTTEIKIHSSLDHKNIVRFHRYFEDNQFVYILLEVCKCRSLMELMRNMTQLREPEAAFIMYQILVAVKHMHDCMIIHRDLKLGNLFLTERMEVKIGDFGLAAQLDYRNQRKQTLCGTPNYIAPEILRSTGHSYEVDVWSIGVIFYTLLIGTPPFETSSVKETYKNIRDNRYEFPKESRVSETAKDLIKRILVSDPTKRPTVPEILQHKFFTIHFNDISKCPRGLQDYASLCLANIKERSVVPRPVPVTTERAPFRPITTNVQQVRSSVKVEASPGKQPYSLRKKSSPPPPQVQPSRPVSAHVRSVVAPPAQSAPHSSRVVENGKPTESRPRTAIVPTDNQQQVSPGLYRRRPTTSVPTGRPSPTHVQQQPQQQVSVEPPPQSIKQTSPPVTSKAQAAAAAVVVDSKEDSLTQDDQDDLHNMTNMHENLTKSMVVKNEQPIPAAAPIASKHKVDEDGDINLIQEQDQDSALHQTRVWVCKWADFSTKYGLAYQLNCNTTGAHFNDDTKIIWNHDNGQIDYIERVRAKDGSPAFEDTKVYHIDRFPQTLTKKVTLVKHFRLHLDSDGTPAPSSGTNSAHTRTDQRVYVKRWIKTRSAFIFRLSNKVVQVRFHDNTEIILSSEARLVTYTDPSGSCNTFTLSFIANNPNTEINRRLKYTKDILYQLIHKTH
ncbi:polo-like protein kinase PLK1 [Acrasis kona]|uniref:Serine/threonine-protein kinase PLK n=1 Tax=Acrasis kona TaxID=1008807 RepID=A0AAW2YPL2_9EUKA